MTLQSDSYYFYQLFPFWVILWLIATVLASIFTGGFFSFGVRYAVMGLLAAIWTAYSATLLPWFTEELLLGASPQGQDPHVMLLTQQAAVALCASVALGGYSLSWTVLFGWLPLLAKEIRRLPTVANWARESYRYRISQRKEGMD